MSAVGRTVFLPDVEVQCVVAVVGTVVRGHGKGVGEESPLWWGATCNEERSDHKLVVCEGGRGQLNVKGTRNESGRDSLSDSA